VTIPRGTSNRPRVPLFAALLLATLGLVAAGCGGSSAASARKGGVAGARQTMRSAVVKTRKISGLGVVLVNARGRTLYVFMKDARRHVTCTGQCAVYWPPLKWRGAGKPKAGGAAKARLLGLDRNPSGGRVVTYGRWPLYTYAADSAAGQANGENLKLNGGKWYVITPRARLVKHRS